MSVSDNITNGVYKVSIPFPERVSHKCQNPECDGFPKNVNYCPNCGTPTNIEERRDAYLEAREAYSTEERRLMAQFKIDALEEVGLTEVPNADAIYDYAWETGHTNGIREVLMLLHDVAELVIGSWEK